MDLKIEVSPKADYISASALGIVNTLLYLTDKKSAPASTILNGKRFRVILPRPLGAATN
jgi:hypothetical protein